MEDEEEEESNAHHVNDVNMNDQRCRRCPSELDNRKLAWIVIADQLRSAGTFSLH